MKELDRRRQGLQGRQTDIFTKDKNSFSYLQETTFTKLEFKRQLLFTKYLCLWFSSERLLSIFKVGRSGRLLIYFN